MPSLLQPVFRLARSCFQAAILMACLLGTLTPAQARSPVEVGHFTRGDGTLVTAIENDHGITKYRHTSCWFALPDGSTIEVSQTRAEQKNPYQRRYQACAIRTLDAAAEIYLFPSTRLPLAESVLRFDGHAFADITSTSTRWFSPMMHLIRHWQGYLMCVVLLLPFLILEAMIVKRTCGRGWWRTLRRMTIGACIGIVGFYILITTLLGPYSPLLYALIVTIAFLSYRATRKALGF
jgi:hypothetical protein